MPDLSRLPLPDLSRMATTRRWLLMSAATLALTVIATRFSIPAGVLLSAIISGIFMALSGGEVAIPKPLFAFAQSVVGCMIARSISAETLRDILERWPLYALMVLSVSLAATFLGWLLARTGVLPGTTAIWGTSPGGALVMTLMSDDYGADSRLVAFMQYSRLLLVSLAASLVAGIWGEPVQSVATATAAAAFDHLEFAKTVAVVAGCAGLSGLLRVPSAPIILPLVVVPILSLGGFFRVELPWWLLWGSYFIVGWRIGLRYTRDIVAHALGAFFKIMVTLIAMILSCGAMGMIFGRLAGIDPLTAYLATSPGGMDSVAIIVSSTGGNMSLVMAVQMTRFVIVTLTSPFIAKQVGKSVANRDGDKK